MAKRLPNPNTAYGRKRIREEQYFPKKENNSTEEDNSKAILGVIVLVIIIVLAILVRLTNNGEYIGPRGGHFHYNSSGNKVYEK
jgi:hypothetical protein